MKQHIAGDGTVFTEHYERVVEPGDFVVLFDGTNNTQYGSYLGIDRYERTFPPPKRPPVLAPVASQVCRDCKRELAVEEFSKSGNSKTGRNYRCKGCCVVRQRAWEKKHRAKERAAAAPVVGGEHLDPRQVLSGPSTDGVW